MMAIILMQTVAKESIAKQQCLAEACPMPMHGVAMIFMAMFGNGVRIIIKRIFIKRIFIIIEIIFQNHNIKIKLRLVLFGAATGITVPSFVGLRIGATTLLRT